MYCGSLGKKSMMWAEQWSDHPEGKPPSSQQPGVSHRLTRAQQARATSGWRCLCSELCSRLLPVTRPVPQPSKNCLLTLRDGHNWMPVLYFYFGFPFPLPVPLRKNREVWGSISQPQTTREVRKNSFGGLQIYSFSAFAIAKSIRVSLASFYSSLFS